MSANTKTENEFLTCVCSYFLNYQFAPYIFFLKLPTKVSAFLPPITLFQENITDVSSFTISKYFDHYKQTSCHTLKKEWAHEFKFGSRSDSVNIH